MESKNWNLSDILYDGLDFEEERFQNPDNCFFPVYWWLWNTKLDREEIKKQIDEMYEADIRGILILAEDSGFDPLIFTELEPAYLTDEFMEFVKFAVDYAVSKNMQVWLYDEAGWPSGHAGGLITKERPDLGRKVLRARKVALPCGEVYKLPEDGVAAYVNDARISEGFRAEEDVEIDEYYYHILSNYNADISEPEAVAQFQKLTHEKYKKYVGEHFGKNVSLMFTDEPCNPYPAFTYGFADKFRETYGYDILDYLPVIVNRSGKTEPERKALTDYLKLCGELFRDNFMKQHRNWCQENGLLAGGHMGGEHDPRYCYSLARSNDLDCLCQLEVPGVDTIWRQIRWKDKEEKTEIPCRPSEDIHIITQFFPRLASSAAHINGTNLALCESFAVYGSGLTINEMRYVINYQLVRGVNIHSFMNISYGRDRFYAFSQRPSFGSEKPGYQNLSALNKYTARASYINTIGKTCIDTALYLPDYDLRAGGEVARDAFIAYKELGAKLEMQGIEFDIIEDYGIEKAVLKEDSVVIGNAEYKHIYIPENLYMPEETRRKLAPYVTEATPVCKSTAGFDSLRISKRILSDGAEVYFMYNEGAEGTEPLETSILIDSEAANLYELNLVSGEIYHAVYDQVQKEKVIRIRLASGESKAFISTSQAYSAVDNPLQAAYKNVVELTGFEAGKVSEFVLDVTGGYRKDATPAFEPIELGSWSPTFGEAFSGDAVYRTKIQMAEKPSGRVVLELGKVQHSARVSVNGTYAGTAVAYPMVVVADGELFHAGENCIEILVSNTAANQFVLSDAEKNYKPGELDHFHKYALNFEREAVDGGLYGPVIIKYN